MPQYTKEFSQFIAKMDFSCLNSTDIAAVCSCLKDFVAVTIAGSSGREAEIWQQYYSVIALCKHSLCAISKSRRSGGCCSECSKWPFTGFG